MPCGIVPSCQACVGEAAAFAVELITMDLPDLKPAARYGYYPWWPQDGDDWLHPEDVALARELLPGPRVFRREGEHGVFSVLRYGGVRLRVKPALWQEVAWEGFDVGDWVEVLSRGLQNTPRTGVIGEMQWDAHAAALRYQIREADQRIETWYGAADLRHVDPTPPLGQ
jgi:hypothetical protein